MIIEPGKYIKLACNNCGNFLLNPNMWHRPFFNFTPQAKAEAAYQDWKIVDEKHYCPSCKNKL